ncbi:MAG: metal-sulfur cluster assembly factor [Epsilonproteobacteria bacterium]|nr:metal-sulfur cluster assembly factor [Campylobacterota bacterium]
MAYTTDDIYNAISTVIDPEVGFNLVEMGLIYDVELEEEDAVLVTMTLSTPSCPLHEMLLNWTKEAVLKVEGVKSVDVNLTFDPPWNPSMANDDVKKKLGAA